MKKTGIEYRVYTKSKTATSFSAIASFCVFFFLTVFTCLTIAGLYWFLIFDIPLVVFRMSQQKVEKILAVKYPNRAGYDYPSFHVSEDEFNLARRVLELGRFHPAIKEIGLIQSKTPRQVIEHYEQVVRNYNLEQRDCNNAEEVYTDYIRIII